MPALCGAAAGTISIFINEFAFTVQGRRRHPRLGIARVASRDMCVTLYILPVLVLFSLVLTSHTRARIGTFFCI